MSESTGLNLSSIAGAAAAALTSAASSICCIGPLAIALLGVNGAILGAAIKPYRPYLLTLAFLLLVFAYWRVFMTRQTGVGTICSARAMRVQKSVLWVSAGFWVAAVLIGFAADRYWL